MPFRPGDCAPVQKTIEFVSVMPISLAIIPTAAINGLIEKLSSAIDRSMFVFLKSSTTQIGDGQ